MAVPDLKLVALIKHARRVTSEKALSLAGVVNGGTDGALVVSRRRVPPKRIQEAKVRCGGTAVFLRRCFRQDGKLVFETLKNAFGTRARLLRHLIARAAGLELPALARQAVKPTEQTVEDLNGEDKAPATDGPEKSTEPTTTVARKKFSPVTYGQTRLVWDTTRKKALGQLQQLQQASVARSADDPCLAEIQVKFKALDEVLLNLDESLSDKLDAALNAAGEQRNQFHGEAAALLAKYRAYVQSDPLLGALDDNPYFAVTMRQDRAATLKALARIPGA